MTTTTSARNICIIDNENKNTRHSLTMAIFYYLNETILKKFIKTNNYQK